MASWLLVAGEKENKKLYQQPTRQCVKQNFIYDNKIL